MYLLQDKIKEMFENLMQVEHPNIVKFHKYWLDTKDTHARVRVTYTHTHTQTHTHTHTHTPSTHTHNTQHTHTHNTHKTTHNTHNHTRRHTRTSKIPLLNQPHTISTYSWG